MFFLLPTLNVLLISFRPVSPNGGIGTGWTLDTLRDLADPNYPAVVFRTLWISLTVTFGCLAAAVPTAYFMARARPKLKTAVVLLIMIPFLTNFLIRVFAWKVILHPDGLLGRITASLGLLEEGAQLLYNPWAVIVVSIYSYLPFAILPVYAAAEKFDFTLLEAALDLGCRRWEAFRKVFLPGVRQGLHSAALLVFVPNLGAYVIPEIVGGHNGAMLGNKVAQRLFTDRNLPHAAGLSSLLTLLVVIPLVAVIFIRRRRRPAEHLIQEGA